MADVGIIVNKALDDGAIVGPPDKNRSIRWFGQRAGKNQLSTAMGLPSEREVLIPEGGSPGEIVIDQCVLQQVVTHGQARRTFSIDFPVASSSTSLSM